MLTIYDFCRFDKPDIDYKPTPILIPLDRLDYFYESYMVVSNNAPRPENRRLKIFSFILFTIYFTNFSFGQNERNIKIDIEGGNLISGLRNTNWYLKAIVRKDLGYGSRIRNRLAKKTNPNKNEEQELHFKDSIVEIVYNQNNEKITCKYRRRNNRSDSYHELFFIPVDSNPKDSIVYDVSVYKLNDKKLVAFIGLRKPLSNPPYFANPGRMIFYKKD